MMREREKECREGEMWVDEKDADDGDRSKTLIGSRRQRESQKEYIYMCGRERERERGLRREEGRPGTIEESEPGVVPPCRVPE